MAGRGAHLGDDEVEAVGGVLGAQPHGDVALGVAAQVGAHLPVLLQLHAQRPRAAREQGVPRRRREPGALQEQAGEGAGRAQTWWSPAAFGLPKPGHASREEGPGRLRGDAGLGMGGTQAVRKGSVLCPGLGAGGGLGKMCGSEGQSVGLGTAGCGGSGDEGNGAERRVPWGLAQERKGGRGVGGEPLPCPQGRAAHLMVVLVRRV